MTQAPPTALQYRLRLLSAFHLDLTVGAIEAMKSGQKSEIDATSGRGLPSPCAVSCCSAGALLGLRTMAPRQQAVRRSVVVSSAQWWGQRCSAAGAVAGLAGVQFLNLAGWLRKGKKERS